MWHKWLAVAKEENYKEKINTFQDEIEGGQMIFGGNENQQYDIWGGNKEILIIMGEHCCMKVRRILLRILRKNI